ncbi:hypothetical protein K492DRAFT_177179 [Lichtheimia hyalospora FSU 10163]|nr:hypothetical protein K492DRAFT_177179 [Lichtheimia hyalospora FSU 10163]
MTIDCSTRAKLQGMVFDRERSSSSGRRNQVILEDDKRKLYDHPDFRLVYVTEESYYGSMRMHIIRPTMDSEYRCDVEAKGFYALSHLWGNADQWDISHFVENENGEPAQSIPMRVEKRETLLALLKAHSGSYWWIDVLCARVDTPLIIMGSIYRLCTRCYAMLDCDPSSSEQLHYLMQSSGNIQIDKGRRDIQASLNSRNILMQSIDGRPRHMDFMRQRFTQAALQLFDGCRWFDRVWTLQELLLPCAVTMISERGGADGIHHAFSYDWLLIHVISSFDQTRDNGLGVDILEKSGTLLNQRVKVYRDLASYGRNTLECTIAFIQLCQSFSRSPRICHQPEDYIYGVLGLLELDIPRMPHPNLVWRFFLSAIKQQLEWLSENDFIGDLCAVEISERAKGFDLSSARNMSDVYEELFTMLLPERQFQVKADEMIASRTMNRQRNYIYASELL